MPEGRLQGRIHAVLNNKDKGMQVRLRDPKETCRCVFGILMLRSRPTNLRIILLGLGFLLLTLAFLGFTC